MRERTVHLALRATPAEAALIRHAAEAAMLSTSSYLRTLALGGDGHALRLQSLQAELRRQGGLLKHLAARGALDRHATEQALALWREAVQQMAEAAHARQSHHA